MHAYVPLISALIIWKGVPLCQTSAKPDPLPLLSSLLWHRVDPHLKPLEVNPPPCPHLSSLPLQTDVPPLQPSSLRTADPPQISVSLQG